MTKKCSSKANTNLNKRSLLELDNVIEEVLKRNPWVEKKIDKIIKESKLNDRLYRRH